MATKLSGAGQPDPLALVIANRILSRPPRSLHPEEITEAVELRQIDRAKAPEGSDQARNDAPTEDDRPHVDVRA